MDRKNKVLLAAAIGAAAILVASTLVRCTVTRTVETPAADSPAASQQTSANQGEEVGMDESVNQKVLGVLRSHAWQAEGDASRTVAFRDGSLVESDAKGVKVTAFEVTGAHEDDDHASLDVTMTREGAGSFSCVIAVDGREGSLAVSSDGFANASRYVQGTGAGGAVAVEGLAEPYTTLVDGRTDELESAVAAYCRDCVPTTTKATFDGEVYLDMANDRVTATFHCDDRASTILSVTYASGTFKVSG